jgi:uncharacterized lipoprotein YddW (UPF0748 family)
MFKSGFLFLLISMIAGLVTGCAPAPELSPTTGMRGVYVQARSIATPEEADETLTQLEVGRFDTVFVNVLAYGHAFYESDLLEKHPDVEDDFDPLAYFLERAHGQGIGVHAWLVLGPVGYDGLGPILQEHPDWAMIGPDGSSVNWLNYTRPDVRRFIVAVVSELAQDYAVEGVHFDYTRYPGAQWGFDPYSTALFSDKYGIDPNLFRYERLPAYATFAGNPLIWPGSAEVLAEFDNGQPAVTINKYGTGHAILLNWDATAREVVAGSQILDRGIDHLLGPGGQVYVLKAGASATSSGSQAFRRSFAWLEDLGRQPTDILDSDIAILDAGSVLVLPGVYRLTGQVASDLADYVHRGGGAILIDGPTPSIWNLDVRAVTGMLMRGRHFGRSMLLIPTQEHEIIPTSSRKLPQETYKALDRDWKAFRAEAINELLAEVYAQAKPQAPELLLSISVSYDQELLAQQHLLEWQTWLDTGTVERIFPRAYVAPGESLGRALSDWRPIMAETGQITLALSTYTIGNEKAGPKTPDRVLSEVEVALQKRSVGIILFDLEHTSHAVLDVLAASPLWTRAAGIEKQGE